MTSKYVSYLKSPIGEIKITADEKSVTSVLFVFKETEIEEENINSLVTQCKSELSEYFAGKRKEFEVPFNQVGTEFQQRVWTELTKINYGDTVSYNYIAKAIDNQKSIRAVGTTNGKNQISIIVPCHRVIGSDGSLTGYAGGIWRKKWLLNHEKEFSGAEKQMELF